MCRDARRIKSAMNITKLSHHKFPMAALLFKGSIPISVGVNRYRSHPKQINPYTDQKGTSTHAELDCILGTHKEDLIGATIYIARRLKSGKPGIARPCKSCMAIIRASGIKLIVYTTYKDYEVEEVV